jgi:Mg/Co/Ni transporter MgtE
MKIAKEGAVTLSDLQEGIEKSFIQYMQKEKNTQDFAQMTTDEVIESFEEFEEVVLGVKKGSLIKGRGSSK